MMPINLNLLPKEKKARLERMVKFMFVKNLLGFTAIVASVIATLLLWGWMVLIDEFSGLSQSANLLSRDYSSQNQEVRQVNTILKQMKENISGYNRPSDYLVKIANSLPENIKINSILIDTNTKTISLSGISKTREDLIDYQDLINQSDWLDPISMPVSQLIKKENISFEFKTKLK